MMLKNYLRKLWGAMRRDPVLLVLLVMAAVYFFLYYATDPARPGGIFPTILGHRDSTLYNLGWYGFYDQSQYLRLAHTLAGFHLHQLKYTYTYGLGYPLVAIPAIWLGFNKDPFVFFNFAAFIFSIYAIYKVAYKLISPFAGFIAGFGLLFATPLLHYVDQPWNSTVCLVAMSVILLTLTVKKITKWHALLIGLVVGWAFAARYIDVIFLGALGLACMYRGSIKSLYKPIVYMAVGGAIFALPVFVSQYKIFGSPFRTPYVNHLGIGGVDGSDQGLKAYSAKRIPNAALAIFVSPRLAGSHDNDRGLLIDFFWALAAIPGLVLLIKKKKHVLFMYTLLATAILSALFYLSFRASTSGALKYGELHYFKMFWPCFVLLAAAFFDYVFTKAHPRTDKPSHQTARAK
jgi:energy-converting hydrogenase Eha subunit C